MRRLCLYSLLAAVLSVPLFSAPGSTSMPSFWRYAHPEAKALIGVEWNRILHSSIGAQLRQKLHESGAGGAETLELVDQVQRLFISSPGKQDAAEGNPPVAIAAQGAFDLDKVREMAEAQSGSSSTYREVEILQHVDDKGKPTALALVSPQLVVMGDIESVTGAIDHYMAADPGLMSNPLFSRAAELSSQNDIWLVANASPSDFGQAGAQQPRFMQEMERVEAGISLRSGLGLELNLGAKTPQSAAEMAAGLKMLLGMALSSQQQQPGMSNLAEKLQVSTEGDLVRLAMHMDETELQHTFGQIAASLPASMGGGEAGVAQTASVANSPRWSRPAVHREPEAPKGPRVITIWGLEEGPKEITLNEE